MNSFNNNQCFKIITTKWIYTQTLAIPHYLFAANYPLERHDVTVIFCGWQICEKKGAKPVSAWTKREIGTQTWDDRCSRAFQTEFQTIERKLRWRMTKRRRRQKGWRGKKAGLRRKQKKEGEDRKWALEIFCWGTCSKKGQMDLQTPSWCCADPTISIEREHGNRLCHELSC